MWGGWHEGHRLIAGCVGAPSIPAYGRGRCRFRGRVPFRQIVESCDVGHREMGLDEQIDQQRIDLRAVAIDLVILRATPLRRVLETIGRALAGQRLAVRWQHRFQFARQHRERQVLAQLIVIEKVLVAQRQAKNPLPHQRLHPMLFRKRNCRPRRGVVRPGGRRSGP